jgi:hypothetical protein
MDLLTAVAGNGMVNLTWTGTTSNNGFVVKYGSEYGGPYREIVPNVNASACKIDELANGTRFYFFVSAVDAGGRLGAAAEANAVPSANPDAVPTQLTAEPGDGNVTLKWIGHAGDASFTIHMSTNRDDKNAMAFNPPDANTEMTIKGLTNGQVYYFTVTATHGALSSDQSIEVAATPGKPSQAKSNVATSTSGQSTQTITHGHVMVEYSPGVADAVLTKIIDATTRPSAQDSTKSGAQPAQNSNVNLDLSVKSSTSAPAQSAPAGAANAKQAGQ